MKKELLIEGMTCAHCASHVSEALNDICGVKSAKVDLKGKTALVELAHEVDSKKFKEAIDEAGYRVVDIKEL
jgi:copper chaperone CopZ